MWSDYLSQKCAMSLTPCFRKGCDETVFKMCNVTHSLLVIGKDVMRLPVTKVFNVTHSLLVIGNDVIRLSFTKTHMQWSHHSQPVGINMIRQHFRKMCNVTHSLLVIGKGVTVRLPFIKMCNVTHKLLVVGKDVISLPFENVQCHLPPLDRGNSDMIWLPFKKCAMSLTTCLS